MKSLIYLTILLVLTQAAPKFRGSQKTLSKGGKQCDGTFDRYIDGPVGTYCLGKNPGENTMSNHEFDFMCGPDRFGSGWIKVGGLMNAQTTGDNDRGVMETPDWYNAAGMGGCNQFMFVDEGTNLDYHTGGASWNSEGIDLEKHIFPTLNDDGTQGEDLKVNMGGHTAWGTDNYNYIPNYSTEEASGVCMFGNDNVDYCFNYVMFDYWNNGNPGVIPRFNGLWDVESKIDHTVGDNTHKYAVTLYCRAQSNIVTDPYSYIGCFRDDGERDFDHGPREYGYDPASCRDACSDFAYFALQNNGWCSCDNSYGTPAD